jgi:CBS domain containing-hemolysin-like protein
MTPPAWLLVAAAVLALAAGLCARGEAALTLMSATGVTERPDQKHPEHKRPEHKRPEHKRPDDQTPLRTVTADLPRYLSVLLLLRAACEVFAAVLVTAAFVRWFGDDWRAVFGALAVVIALRYTLTGVRPQASAARPRVERTAERAAAFLFPLTRALGPLPRLLVAVGNVMPPGRRKAPSDREGPEARSELRGLVDYLERRTGIEPGEREMVRSVFELGDTIVREVMVPRTDMVFIESDRTVEQALSLALHSGFSRIPVVGENEDDVVGIAYLKDIVAWSHEHPGAEATEKVATVMRSASYVPDSKPVNELLRQMQAQRNHVAIVIDEYGGTAGLVTIEDILEEIVGEITDEYDNERPPVEWLPDGSARVTARLSVTELEELFGVRVDDEDVETVAGLLAHQLGRVPIAGSTATVRGLRLTAENLVGRRNKILTVLVERDEEPES